MTPVRRATAMMMREMTRTVISRTSVAGMEISSPGHGAGGLVVVGTPDTGVPAIGKAVAMELGKIRNGR